jgi:hypothetical protein
VRVLECVCGVFLRGETDDELFARVYEHVDRHHSELGFGEERLHTIVVNAAYWPEKDGPAVVGLVLSTDALPTTGEGER